MNLNFNEGFNQFKKLTLRPGDAEQQPKMAKPFIPMHKISIPKRHFDSRSHTERKQEAQLPVDSHIKAYRKGKLTD